MNELLDLVIVFGFGAGTLLVLGTIWTLAAPLLDKLDNKLITKNILPWADEEDLE